MQIALPSFSEAMRFIIWDYNKHIATEYERIGYCNGCGRCCTIGMTWRSYNPIDESNPGNGDSTTSGSGIWCEVDDDGGVKRFYEKPIFLYRNKPCELLTENNRCSIQLTKQQMNKDYPFHPEQVDIPLSQCSYRFIGLAQWKF